MNSYFLTKSCHLTYITSMSILNVSLYNLLGMYLISLLIKNV